MFRTALGGDAVERYSRHMLMPQIGVEGQARLLRSKVLVVGAGGLGSTALLYLAAAGVGTLGVADDDRVELSNLQRQIIHGVADVGRLKVESARDAVARINPGVEVEIHPCRVGSRNAADLVSRYDIVVDAVDNVAARYVLNDTCVALGRVLVSGAAIRMEGTCSVYNAPPGAGPCYRCLFPVPPPAESVTSCSDGGVLGVVPGLVGCVEALEAIKCIVGGLAERGRADRGAGLGEEIGDASTGRARPRDWDARRSLAGKLLVVDAEDARFATMRLRGRSATCAACGDNAQMTVDTIRSFDYDAFCGTPACALRPAAVRSRADDLPELGGGGDGGTNAIASARASRVESQGENQDNNNESEDGNGNEKGNGNGNGNGNGYELGAEDVRAALSDPNCVVVDVRSDAERAMCWLEGTEHVRAKEVGARVAEITSKVGQGGRIVFLCRRGVSSRDALESYRSVVGDDGPPGYHFKGGLQAWTRDVDPTFPLY